MSIALESPAPRRFEDVIRNVSELNGIGSLADDVVMDAYRVESGALDATNSKALTAAARLFHAALESKDHAQRTMDAPSGALVFYMNALGSVSRNMPNAPEHPNVYEMLGKISNALDGLLAGDKSELTFVEDMFDSIARSTLAAARNAVDSSSYLVTWSE
jgi:hypothetical protein